MVNIYLLCTLWLLTNCNPFIFFQAHYKGTSQDGDRARSLANARDEQKAQFEKLKQKSHDRANTGLKALSKQFIGNVNVIEDQFKASTVGLVSAADFKAKRKAVRTFVLFPTCSRSVESHV